MKIAPALFLSIFLNICFAYSQERQFQLYSDFEKTPESKEWTNTESIVYDSLMGTHFSKTDSGRPYGIGYKSNLPPEFQFQSVRAEISAKVFIHNPTYKSSLVVTINKKDSTVFWDAKSISGRNILIGQWFNFTTSIDLPSNFTKEDCQLLLFFWNENGKSEIDFDNVKIAFSRMNFPSFFPVTKENTNVPGTLNEIAGSRHFIFFVDQEQKHLTITSEKSDTLFSDLNLIFEYAEKRKQKIKRYDLTSDFKFSIRKAGNGNGVEINFENKSFKGLVSICEAEELAQLSFSANVSFLKDCFIQRIALVMKQNLPLQEVFKRNTQRDTSHFKKEYWLEKEGYSLSSPIGKMVVYRPDLLSSIQLSDYGKLVAFNFDFSADHPLMHFPKLGKSKSIFEDRSLRNYFSGDSLSSSFHFDLLRPSDAVARLAKNPDGFSASLVWTEHADYGDLRTHRAVNFGSDEITAAAKSIGGFAGHHIPVTKSVFYCNPEKQSLLLKDARFPGESSSITGSAAFKNFLDELNKIGFEICLHTPDPFTTRKDTLERALDFMQKNYGSPTWIDHGYDNSPISNREDLACDGTEISSPVYAIGLWKKYGVKYLWNNFYEDSFLLNRYSFNSFFSVPYVGWNDAFPTPEYWITPLRGDTIYSWRTGFTLDPADGSLWSYYFNDQRLNEMVESNSDCILHCYPSRVDSSNGFYVIDDQAVKVNPEFDKILAKLHNYEENRLIWIPTIKELMDYRLSISNLVLQRKSDGSSILENRNNHPVQGITLVCSERLIFPQGFIFEELKRAGEYVFIFTLQPQQKIELSVR